MTPPHSESWRQSAILAALDQHAIVSVTDRFGRITSVNDRFCAISGYPRDELLGRTHSIVKSGRHDDGLYRDLWRTISSGAVWHGVICNRRKNGGVYWVQSTIMPQRDEAGEISGYVSVRTDVTERVLAQEHSSLLSQVLNQADRGVAIMDMAGELIYVNTAAARALGCEAAVLLGRHFVDLVMPVARRRCLAWLAGITTCDYRWEGLLSLRCTDGRPFRSRSHVGVVPDAMGSPKYVFNIFSDHADERRRLAALREARKSAEQANAAKSAFLSATSHELRTPLNAVLGFAQLLTLNLQDERLLGFTREINVAGRHLLALIDEMLDLAKIEAGREELLFESVDLTALVSSCRSLMLSLASPRAIELRSALPAHPVRVMADRKRLQQVVLNLISNAIKYSREGATVRFEVDESCQRRTRLTVVDQGPGIRPELLHRLFEPFSRLDAESRGIEGSGMGLVISKRLIERMGGAIGVSSEPGEGSCFWIELRAATM
jgi:PAS domain S-box-containing protein